MSALLRIAHAAVLLGVSLVAFFDQCLVGVSQEAKSEENEKTDLPAEFRL